MNAENNTLSSFIEALGSGAPTPGGGGAAALSGALASALSDMVCNLTLGKKKYADVEEDIRLLKERASALSETFLRLIDADAEAFAPLAAAYRLPKDTEEERAEKERILQAALAEALQPPLSIMRNAALTIDLLTELAEKGASIAISDVGVGAALANAALRSGYLNVIINTSAMTEREKAERINTEARALLEACSDRANGVFDAVADRLR